MFFPSFVQVTLLLASAVVYCSAAAVNATQSPSSTYDFIIAGGGTAGISLAARLTENPAFKVLVIEAGPKPDSINQDEQIPGLDFFLEGSNLDWNFTTIDQPTLNGRSFLYTRGKCLGGSSVVNFMAYTRGSSSVFDLWESMGNPGWNWDTVFPYFKKSTHFTPPSTTNNSQITFNPSFYNASGGPLQISFGEYTQPYDQYWYPALQEIGVPLAVDFNGGNGVGVAHETTTINPADESRSSAYTSFYAAAKSRSNLHVMTDTLVEQVLIRGHNSSAEAYGVKYTSSSGVTSFAYASKEVIVSAGAVQTPQLLMLSGVGPQATLQKFNITPYAYLEGLGQRFQDHASFYVNVEVSASLPTIGLLLQNSTAFTAAINQWGSNHSGPLASMNGDTIGFQRLTNAQLTAIGAQDLIALGSDWPNIEFLLLPAYDNPGFPNPPNATGNYLTIAVALVSPTSMGSISISSTNINDPPIIDVNYLSTTDDQQVAIQGFKNAIAIAESNAFKPVFLGRENVVPPAASVATDAEILVYVRNVMTTIWHASGTAAMMPQKSGGVVDSELRVYGVQNLRIVDASVQPRITNQHVQAVVYMIAERAADFLKAQYA